MAGARHHDEMVREIQSGQVIVHGGRVIKKAEDVPSESMLAGTDIRRKQHALGDIKRRAEEARKELEEAAKEAGVSPDEVEIESETAAPDEVPDLKLGAVDEVPVAGVKVRKQSRFGAES